MEDRPFFDGLEVDLRLLGSVDRLDDIARGGLYLALRSLDEAGVDFIVAREFGSQWDCLAIQDRLRRAATHREE